MTVIDDDSNVDEGATPVPWSRLREYIAVVTWSSFLIACLSTMLFFAFVDPNDLFERLNHPSWATSRMAGYALGFFFFWLIAASAATLTTYMLDTSRERFTAPTPSPKVKQGST